MRDEKEGEIVLRAEPKILKKAWQEGYRNPYASCPYGGAWDEMNDRAPVAYQFECGKLERLKELEKQKGQPPQPRRIEKIIKAINLAKQEILRHNCGKLIIDWGENSIGLQVKGEGYKVVVPPSKNG